MTKKDKHLEEIENLKNQLKRTLADYQNLEKRVAQDKENWIKLSNEKLILQMLPFLDNLILAQKHLSDEGLNLSIEHFLTILKTEGLEKIQTEGVEFNPHEMECTHVDEGPEGKIIEETRAGYKLHGKVIRPSQVVVGKETN